MTKCVQSNHVNDCLQIKVNKALLNLFSLQLFISGSKDYSLVGSLHLERKLTLWLFKLASVQVLGLYQIWNKYQHKSKGITVNTRSMRLVGPSLLEEKFTYFPIV